MNSTAKTILFWISIVFLGVMLWKLVKGSISTAEHVLTYDEFVTQLDRGNFKEATLSLGSNAYEIEGEYREPVNQHNKFRTTIFKEVAPDLIRQLRDRGIRINVKEVRSADWVAILLNSTPTVLLVGFALYLIRQMQTGGNKALSFGKSRARLLSAQQKKATFKDFAGNNEAKEELQEIIEFLKDPQKFQKLGGRIPKGALLVGPPGTGKTLLARAIAGEASVPFFSISGSDFVEMFVGVGASRVRDLFEQGKKNAPCIIFIDEIDAVGRHRGAGLGGGHDEREQTLNALLVEMDGFESNDGVILIAATNRPDVLDPALLRPGRFDRRVSISYPNTRDREEILRVHSRRIPLDDSVSLLKVAELTPGFAGADLSMVMNEAAITAARGSKKFVAVADLEVAVDRVRRGMKEKISLEAHTDKWRVALHEAGHLSASFTFPCLERIESLTLYRPYRPDWFRRIRLLTDVIGSETAKGTLVVLMAGRAAEVLFLNEQSNLGANDAAVATALAYEMVARWGMDEELGLVNDRLLREIAPSDAGLTRVLLESESLDAERQEVKKLLDEAYSLALSHVTQNAAKVSEWAAKLFEEETLGPRAIDQMRSAWTLGARMRPFPKGEPAAQQSSGTTLNTSQISHAELSDCRTDEAAGNSDQARKRSVLKRKEAILELQVAALGLNAPPHLVIQLEDVKKELNAFEKS